MERAWKFASLCLVVSFFKLCNGLPIHFERTIISDPHTQLVAGFVAVILTLCTVVGLFGCLCCHRGSGFKEFRDSPVTISAVGGVDNGLVNPTADAAFTIFAPLVHQSRSEDRIRMEDYIYGDINVSSWFNEGEYDFPRAKLKYIRELGKGWFGKVVEGTAQDLEGENIWTTVVVRILDSTAYTKERVFFLNEAEIYRCGEHPNILKLFGRCLDSVPFLLLQEFCPQGDLKSYLLSNKPNLENLLSSEYPLIWCCHITSAVKFLHEKGLAHADLACRNCQLTSNLTLKLGDYGLASSKYPEDYYEGVPSISVRWCAPESISHTSTTIQPERITREANVWSLAVCFWEICECGDIPYHQLSDDEVVTQVLGKAHVRLPRPSHGVLYTDYIYRLMQSCWLTPESRPTATQIYLTLTDLLQVFTVFKTENQGSMGDSQESFDLRWNSLKPNNQSVSNRSSDILESNAVNTTSPSLNNLMGSLEDMDGSRNSDECNAHSVLLSGQSKFEFKLEPQAKDHQDADSLNDSMIYTMGRSSSSETEEENWKTKIERGAYTEKVRQKSRSVTDLMVLTHIDCSESESETPQPSLDHKVNYKNVRLAPKNNLESLSYVHGSEGNLLSVQDDFQEELKKLKEEHRDSLFFVPDNYSQMMKDEQINNNVGVDENNCLVKSSSEKLLKDLSSTSEIKPSNQVFNVFNVTIDNLSPVHVVKLNEIINLEEPITISESKTFVPYEVPKLCDLIQNNSNIVNLMRTSDIHNEGEAMPEINERRQDSLSVRNIEEEVLSSHEESAHNEISLETEDSLIIENDIVTHIAQDEKLHNEEEMNCESHRDKDKITDVVVLNQNITDIEIGIDRHVSEEISTKARISSTEIEINPPLFSNPSTEVVISASVNNHNQQSVLLKSNDGKLQCDSESMECGKILDNITEADIKKICKSDNNSSTENHIRTDDVNCDDGVFCDEVSEIQRYEEGTTYSDCSRFMDEHNHSVLPHVGPKSCDEYDNKSQTSPIVIVSNANEIDLEERKINKTKEFSEGVEVGTWSNNETNIVFTDEKLENCSEEAAKKNGNIFAATKIEKEMNSEENKLPLEIRNENVIKENQEIFLHMEHCSSNIDVENEEMQRINDCSVSESVDKYSCTLPLGNIIQADPLIEMNDKIENIDEGMKYDIYSLEVENELNSSNSIIPSNSELSSNMNISEDEIVKFSEMKNSPQNDTLMEFSENFVNSLIKDGLNNSRFLNIDKELDLELCHNSINDTNCLNDPNLSNNLTKSSISRSSGSEFEYKVIKVPDTISDNSPQSDDSFSPENETIINSIASPEVNSTASPGNSAREKKYSEFSLADHVTLTKIFLTKENEANKFCPTKVDKEERPTPVDIYFPTQVTSKTSCQEKRSENLIMPNGIRLYQVPKLIELIENNDTLMDYIISNYESEVNDDLSCDISCKTNSVNSSKTVVVESESEHKKLNEDSNYPTVDFDLSDSQDITNPNSLTHLNVFSSLKTKQKSLDVITSSPINKSYSSLRDGDEEIETIESTKLNYSLETWDNFLGHAIDSQNQNINDQTFVFESLNSEPQSLIFIDTDEPKPLLTPPNSDIEISLEDQPLADVYQNEVMGMDGDHELNETFDVEDVNKTYDLDDTFTVYDTSREKDESSGSWETKSGWFLHPQSSRNVSGQITEQKEADSFTRFGMDDEILAALRGELLAKLPHAQGNSSGKVKQVDYDWNPNEKDGVYLRYNVYNTPLSPIPEESESDHDADSGCTTPGSPASVSSEDWPEKPIADAIPEDIDSRSLKAQVLYQQQTLSQDSCCSNDTLFNLEDMTCVSAEQEKETDLNQTAEIDDTKRIEEERIKTEAINYFKLETSATQLESPIIDLESPMEPLTDATYVIDFLDKEREHSELVSVVITDTAQTDNDSESNSSKYVPSDKHVAPLPSPDEHPWKQLSDSLLSFDRSQKRGLLYLDHTKENTPSIDTASGEGESKNYYKNISIELNDEIEPEYSNINKSQQNGEALQDYVNLGVSSKDVIYENIDDASDILNEADYVIITNLENFKMNSEYSKPEVANISERMSPEYINANHDENLIIENVQEDQEDELYGVLTDIRFSGPGEPHLMSTSFSESNDLNNEQDWDSGSDTRSSSSGEFIWKLDDVKPKEEHQDDTSSDSSCSDEDGDCPEFIPSAWDKYATPTKSALRSPEKTIEKEEKKKGVWFKKQRYHCVYEYPREPESPILQSFDLWNNPPPATSYPDWYFDIDSGTEFNEFTTSKSPSDGDILSTEFCSDFNDEFFVTGSATPFDIMGGTSSQFFPGSDQWSELAKLNDNTTPDSGVEDITPGSSDALDFGSIEQPCKSVPSLKSLAESTYSRLKQREKENRTNEILGGLRHTRDKLKLDLPPSPSTFTANKTFNLESNIEPVILRERPSFTTFGKSRFLVQHVDTPDLDIKGNNVCFEALPYKPPEINLDLKGKKLKKEEEKGEASLLDSADEDSGIESSTLERKSGGDLSKLIFDM